MSAEWTLRDARRVVARSDFPSLSLSSYRSRERAPGISVSRGDKTLSVQYVHVCVHGAGHVVPEQSDDPDFRPGLYGQGVKGADALRELDRLISRLGPRWPETAPEQSADPRDDPRGPAESRPKGTSEVLPGAEPGAGVIHGGDGASGEVSEPGGAPRRPAEITASEHSSSPRPDAPRQDAMPAEGPRGGDCEEEESSPRDGAPAEDEPRSGEPTAHTAPTGADSDVPGESPDGARESVTPDAAQTSAKERDAGGPVTASPSDPLAARASGVPEAPPDPSGSDLQSPDRGQADSQPRTGARETDGSGRAPDRWHGPAQGRTGGSWSHHDPVESREIARVLRRKRTARRLLRALERWLDRDVGSHGDPTPRLDARRLTRELVSRSVRISRCRREEHERSTAILAVDTSGSCSVWCAETMAAAIALAVLDDRLIVVEHCNGVPWRAVSYRGEAFAADRGYQDPAPQLVADWWVRQCETAHTSTIVWLGDDDGQEIRRLLAERAVEIDLLDNYTSSLGRVRRTTRAEPWCRRHLVGVGGAETMLAAIAAAGKGE